MKTSLVTGAPYDYVSLRPETVSEATDLCQMAMSQFPQERERLTLVFDMHAHTGRTMELRIRISGVDTKHDPAINAEHDNTP